MRTNPVWALLVFGIFSAASCDACVGGGGESSWLVGQGGGLMLNVQMVTGHTRPHALNDDRDLLDIACRGRLEAWVVGQGGLRLLTADRGQTWRKADVGTSVPLRGVAVSEQGAAYVVGDEGTFFRSLDSGQAWAPAPLPANASGANFTAASTSFCQPEGRCEGSISSRVVTAWSSATRASPSAQTTVADLGPAGIWAKPEQSLPWMRSKAVRTYSGQQVGWSATARSADRQETPRRSVRARTRQDPPDLSRLTSAD